MPLVRMIRFRKSIYRFNHYRVIFIGCMHMTNLPHFAFQHRFKLTEVEIERYADVRALQNVIHRYRARGRTIWLGVEMLTPEDALLQKLVQVS